MQTIRAECLHIIPGKVLLIMDNTYGMLRPKGVPLLGCSYIKGQEFHELKYEKG